MKKYIIFAMIVLALAIFVAACAAPAAPTAAPAAAPTTGAAPQPPRAAGPKILRIGLGSYPDVIDPQKSSYVNEISVLQLCYEGLTALDNKGNIGPGAADKFEASKDATSMTFHIREGLKRADGTAMNASDFEYALKREVDPRVINKQYTDIVADIKGSRELIDAEGKKLSDDELNKMYANYGIKGDDSTRTLTVSFGGPIGFWQYIAFTWVTYPSDKKKVDAAPDNWWTKADSHNCNGPFKIKSIEEGKRIVFEANPNYWRGKPKLDRLEMNFITDEVQVFEAYKKGELDEVYVSSATIGSVNNDATLKAQLLTYPGVGTRALQFNATKKPFDDKNVRIAFSQAWDREAWVRDVLQDTKIAGTRWMPPAVVGSQPNKPGVPAYDPKAAVDTLIKNGYGTADGKKVDCAKLGELKLTYGATAQSHARFQFIAGNIVRAFNCAVTLDPVDPTVYTAMTKNIKTNPQIGYGGWVQDYPHPNNWLTVYWKCTAIFASRYGYCNKDFDALLTKADGTVNFDDAVKLYQQAEDMLINDVPFAFGIYDKFYYLTKPYTNGLKEGIYGADAAWAGQWGPVWTYDVDLTKVPDSYPKQ